MYEGKRKMCNVNLCRFLKGGLDNISIVIKQVQTCQRLSHSCRATTAIL